MDLTRLYNLTTPQLRTEAEQLGVVDTEALSRAQLIQAIKARVGAPNPEGFLSRVWGLARWALQTTSGPEQDPGNVPGEANRPNPSTEAPQAPANASEASANPTGSTPLGVFSSPVGSSTHDEPFPTRTMARILAEQGHYKRALAIYATLLREHPTNPELLQEAEAVRTRSRSRRAEAR